MNVMPATKPTTTTIAPKVWSTGFIAAALVEERNEGVAGRPAGSTIPGEPTCGIEGSL
jgi:hypothetical protein